MSKQPFMSIGIHPQPGETVVTVQESHESPYGPVEITCLAMGQARIQFDHYDKAQAWLAECAELLAAALAERDKPAEAAA